MKTMKQKIDAFLWAFMWLLPFLAYFVAYFRIGNAPDVLSFIDTSFAFPFARDIINQVWNLVFNSNLPIAGLLSYLVAVEVAHCLFDFIVFIPRMAHAFIDWGCSLWQKR